MAREGKAPLAWPVCGHPRPAWNHARAPGQHRGEGGANGAVPRSHRSGKFAELRLIAPGHGWIASGVGSLADDEDESVIAGSAKALQHLLGNSNRMLAEKVALAFQVGAGTHAVGEKHQDFGALEPAYLRRNPPRSSAWIAQNERRPVEAPGSSEAVHVGAHVSDRCDREVTRALVDRADGHHGAAGFLERPMTRAENGVRCCVWCGTQHPGRTGRGLSSQGAVSQPVGDADEQPTALVRDRRVVAADALPVAGAAQNANLPTARRRLLEHASPNARALPEANVEIDLVGELADRREAHAETPRSRRPPLERPRWIGDALAAIGGHHFEAADLAAEERDHGDAPTPRVKQLIVRQFARHVHELGDLDRRQPDPRSLGADAFSRGRHRGLVLGSKRLGAGEPLID